jgi:hypothetical protein
MPWYQVHLAIDDRTIGKHICLYNMFETLFLGLHEPRGAAMFGHRQGSTTTPPTFHHGAPDSLRVFCQHLARPNVHPLCVSR